MHDKLCWWYETAEPRHVRGCTCGVIDKVRADERERIAQEIEALSWDMRTNRQEYRGMTTWVRAMAYIKCARIARNVE